MYMFALYRDILGNNATHINIVAYVVYNSHILKDMCFCMGESSLWGHKLYFDIKRVYWMLVLVRNKHKKHTFYPDNE